MYWNLTLNILILITMQASQKTTYDVQLENNLLDFIERQN